MGRPDSITMSMRELDRCKVIQSGVDDGLMVWRAAEKLGISRRQVQRLAQRYRLEGPQGLVSRRWGRSANNQLPPGLESRARGLIRDSYADFGPRPWPARSCASATALIWPRKRCAGS